MSEAHAAHPVTAPASKNLVVPEGGLTTQQAVTAVGNALTAAAMAEIRLAIDLAIARPRNEGEAISRLHRACKRYGFADKALYRYRRGTSTVSGASIKLAEEMMRVWGNCRTGYYVLDDSKESRTVRGWAWDLEHNYKKEVDLPFQKLIYRKQGGWVLPDERDLLELTGRNGSKAVRNAILSILPWDLVEDAKELCLQTLEKADKEDPEGAKKRMLRCFAELGIGGAELQAYVGYPLEQLNLQALSDLRGVYNAIRDGELTWRQLVNKKAEQEGVDGARPASMTELRKKIEEQTQAQQKLQGGP